MSAICVMEKFWMRIYWKMYPGLMSFRRFSHNFIWKLFEAILMLNIKFDYNRKPTISAINHKKAYIVKLIKFNNTQFFILHRIFFIFSPFHLNFNFLFVSYFHSSLSCKFFIWQISSPKPTKCSTLHFVSQERVPYASLLCNDLSTKKNYFMYSNNFHIFSVLFLLCFIYIFFVCEKGDVLVVGFVRDFIDDGCKNLETVCEVTLENFNHWKVTKMNKVNMCRNKFKTWLIVQKINYAVKIRN